EPRLGAELIDGSGSAVAHAGPQASHELEDEFGQRALVRNAALNAFGNEFLIRRSLVIGALGSGILAVSFMRSLGHGPDGSHAAIGLEAAAAVDDCFSGTFSQAGEEPADHHTMCSRRDRLGDIPRVAD